MCVRMRRSFRGFVFCNGESKVVLNVSCETWKDECRASLESAVYCRFSRRCCKLTSTLEWRYVPPLLLGDRELSAVRVPGDRGAAGQAPPAVEKLGAGEWEYRKVSLRLLLAGKLHQWTCLNRLGAFTLHLSHTALRRNDGERLIREKNSHKAVRTVLR